MGVIDHHQRPVAAAEALHPSGRRLGAGENRTRRSKATPLTRRTPSTPSRFAALNAPTSGVVIRPFPQASRR
jgi:hypothetical protein